MSDLLSILEKTVPELATALLGPAGGVVTSLVESLFGVKGEALPAAIMADPEAAMKLRDLDNKHGEALCNIKLQNYQAEIDDRKSARDREAQVLKLTGKFDWVQHACALLSVLGFFSVIFIVALTKLDQSDHDILYMLLGVLGSTFTQVYQYYFGSSKQQK